MAGIYSIRLSSYRFSCGHLSVVHWIFWTYVFFTNVELSFQSVFPLFECLGPYQVFLSWTDDVTPLHLLLVTLPGQHHLLITIYSLMILYDSVSEQRSSEVVTVLVPSLQSAFCSHRKFLFPASILLQLVNLSTDLSKDHLMLTL